jgi:hypothetical protein
MRGCVWLVREPPERDHEQRGPMCADQAASMVGETRHPGVADGTRRAAHRAGQYDGEDTDHRGQHQRRQDSGSEQVRPADAQGAHQADQDESQ